jgi:sugar phosphate isomerase/epimerase
MLDLGLKLWSHNKEYALLAPGLYEKKVFDYIELYIVPQTFEKFSKIWKGLGIPFLIHSTHSMHGFNLAEKTKLKANLKMFSEVRAFADELNASIIIIHPGIEGTLEESMRQILKLNDKRLAVENKPFVSMNGEKCRGSSFEEISQILSFCKTNFCLDIPHAINAALHLRIDCYTYIKKLLEFDPGIIHIADGRMSKIHDEHLNIGNGEYDFGKISEILGSVKARYLTLETQKRKEDLSDFSADIEKIRALLVSDRQPRLAGGADM